MYRSILFIGSFMFVGCTGSKTLEVRNIPPEAWITSHADQVELLAGDVTLFFGTASDSNHQELDLLTNWYAGNRELCMGVVPEVDGTTTCETALQEGDQVLRLQVVDPLGDTDFDEISPNVIPYTHPEISWESPVGTVQYYSDTPISFRVDIVDDQNTSDELDIVWTSSVDGVLDVSVPDEEGIVDDFLFLSPGAHILELHVSNSGGKSSQQTESITVRPPNQPPTCGISIPSDGDSILAGAQVTFQGQVQDPDVDASELITSWASDQDGLLGSGIFSNGVLTLTTNILSVGVHNIVLSAEDELGLRCTDMIQISVGTPPSVSISQPAAAQVFTLGDDVEMNGQVTDAEDGPVQLVVEWSSNVEGLLNQDTLSSSGFTQHVTSSLSAGAHTLTLTATDPAGFVGTDDVDVYVNTPPEAPQILLTPAAPTSVQDLNLGVTAGIDIDGDPLSYVYRWYKDGVSSGFTSSTLSSQHTSVGEIWMVEVSASDGYTQGPAASASVEIINTFPEVSVPVIVPSSAYNDDILSCSATGTDLDENVSVSYAWDVDGQVYSGATLDLRTLSVYPTDQITCVAQVIDSQQAVDTQSSSVILLNRAPGISFHSILPNVAYAGSILDCNVSFEDPDGEALTISYEWTVGATLLGTNATLTLTQSDAQSGDVIVCSATAEDGYGESIASEAFVTVESVPSFDVAATITPNVAYTGSALVCFASAMDAEDGIVPVSYEWSVGSVVVASGASYIVDGAQVAVGNTLTCTATAADMDQNTVTSVAQLILQNTDPQIDSVSIGPSPLYNDDVVSCEASVFDADESLTPSYSWSIGNQNIGSSSSLSLDSGIASPLDMLTCTVEATDAHGVSVLATENVAIANRPPQAPIVEVTPSIPIIGQDDLICTITTPSTDSDGDAVTHSYEWYVNGVMSSTHTTDTIPTSELQESQEWRCVVTPYDGIEYGSIGSATVHTPAACANTDCDLTVYFPDGTGIDFAEIPAGTFDMGSPSSELGRESLKESQHTVTLSNDFYMMTTEMNQAMFEYLMGYNPSFVSCGFDCAIEKISWHEAAFFSNLLTDYANDYFGMSMDECYSCSGSGTTAYCTESLTTIYDCTGFRLPTEAEWEYAARAETTSAFHNGGNLQGFSWEYTSCTNTVLLDNGIDVGDVAWYCGNAQTDSSGTEIPSPIARKEANNWGLYDMHGNVREWCHDWYAQNYGGTTGTIIDPVGGISSTNRVMRGGSWDQNPKKIRSAYRGFANPGDNLQSFGFRVAKTK